MVMSVKSCLLISMILHVSVYTTFAASTIRKPIDQSYLMQIGSKYVPQLQFDYSLCRIFQPTLEKSSVTFDRGKFSSTRFNRISRRYYIQRMKPLITKSPHYEGGLNPVRFIFLHRCNPPDQQSTRLLEIWSKEPGASQCNSREFFRVSESKSAIGYYTSFDSRKHYYHKT